MKKVIISIFLILSLLLTACGKYPLFQNVMITNVTIKSMESFGTINVEVQGKDDSYRVRENIYYSLLDLKNISDINPSIEPVIDIMVRNGVIVGASLSRAGKGLQ